MPIEQDKEVYSPTDYTCPECHGPISRIDDGSPTRFRCRVGHGYGLDSLTESQSEFSERMLWPALQALEAKLEMERELQQQASGDEVETAALKRRKAETQRQIDLLGQALNLSPQEATAVAE